MNRQTATMPSKPTTLAAGAVACLLLAVSCATSSKPTPAVMASDGSAITIAPDVAIPTVPPAPPNPPIPSLPAPTQGNVYAATGPDGLRPDIAAAPHYAYVPSTDDGTVTVIDQASFKVIDKFDVGELAQHVVPSFDMKTLYVNASGWNQLVPIDPMTGTPGEPIKVDAPYNLYFSPDGRTAIVMAERRQRMDFYDVASWQLFASTDVPCKGINHADWTADSAWFLASCEFSGELLQVSTATLQVTKTIKLSDTAQPQDVRLTPDGTKFYIADMESDKVWIVDATTAEVTGSINTPSGTHGIYPSRDAKYMYVSSRGRGEEDHGRKSHEGEGAVSVIDPLTDTIVATWTIPGGGSPDMGGVSIDGSQLWLSGRFDDEVYVFNTTDGSLLARIKVGGGPHGLALWPQPGRFSLGHTGNTR